MSKRKPKVNSTKNSVVTPSSSSKGKQKKSRRHSPQLKRLQEAPSSGRSRSGKRRNMDEEEVKPVAKIPSSRADASSNWKALLHKQGKSVPVFVPASAAKPISCNVVVSKEAPTKQTQKGVLDFGGSDRSRSVSQARSSSQLSLVSESASSVGTEAGGSDPNASVDSNSSSQKVKQEFRALGLSQQKRQSRSPGKGHKGQQLQVSRFGPEKALKLCLPDGLNDFGFFDYSHYGALRTPITPAHGEYMIDTGIIAMDCEMVGVGPMKESALARVSIVNTHGFCLYNRFVKPKMEVTDYRTEFSGVRENDLKNAPTMQSVVTEVAELLRSHILVGHSLKSDLGVLFLNHPKPRIRDTAFFFKKILRVKMPKLKTLAKKILGVDIQQGEHSSIIDAQATMALYLLYQGQWEAQMRESCRGVNVLQECLEEFKDAQLAKFDAAAPPPPPNLMSSPEPSTSQSQKNWYGLSADNNCNTDYQRPLSIANSSSSAGMPYTAEQMCAEFLPVNCPPHNSVSPVSFLPQPQDCPPFYSSMTPPPEPYHQPFCGQLPAQSEPYHQSFCGHLPPQPEPYNQPFCGNLPPQPEPYQPLRNTMNVNVAVYHQQIPIQIPVQLRPPQVAMPVYSYGNFPGMGMPPTQMQPFPFIPTPPPQRTLNISVPLMHRYQYMAV